MSVNPPYRADVVGSYLRTDAIHEAREANEVGQLSDADLHAIEDREILDLIGKQRDNGLKLATDGEFRRAWWHYDFYDGLANVAVVDSDHGIQFQGVQTKTKVLRVTGKIAFPADQMAVSPAPRATATAAAAAAIGTLT